MIIYKITNLVNGKIYVGQTVRDLDERIAEHKRHDGIVGRAIKKYGEGNFCFEVIDKANNIDELNEKEKYWIQSEHICRVCRGKRKRTGGYRWSYYPKAGDT